jgi:phage/plasmid-like protein (TIGR03299 family)
MTTMIDQEDEVTQFVDDEDVIDEVEVPVEDVLVGPQGNTTFTTRDLPWMKLGPRIDAAVPMEEATKLGGLNFDVELKPLVYRNGDRLVEIPSRRAVIRTNPEMFFAVASDDYQPVQFSEAFSFLDEINPLVSSAGALSGGKKGFMVVQVPGAEKLSVEIDGEVDPHDMYVIVQTSHDLSKAIEIAVMPLRLKCMNMLGLPSLTRDAPQRWSIKHIGDVKRKMHEAQRTVTRATAYADIYARTARQLSSVRVDDDSINVVLKMVLPDKPRREEQITAIKSAFHTSEFVSDGGGSNGWDLLNAVSEYFQWGRTTATRTPQSLFTSGINGDTYRAISRTSQLLLARA